MSSPDKDPKPSAVRFSPEPTIVDLPTSVLEESSPAPDPNMPVARMPSQEPMLLGFEDVLPQPAQIPMVSPTPKESMILSAAKPAPEEPTKEASPPKPGKPASPPSILKASAWPPLSSMHKSKKKPPPPPSSKANPKAKPVPTSKPTSHSKAPLKTGSTNPSSGGGTGIKPIPFPKQPMIMSATPSYYDWSTKDLDFLQSPDMGRKFTIPMTLLTGTFPKGFNLSKQCLQWMPYLGIYSWTNLRSIAPKHTVETLMRTLSVDYYYTYKTDMRIFLALGNILKPGQPWSVPVFSTYHSWIEPLIESLS